jgi:beta-lactamase regulating signal transducer with metallopeptidase domain
MNFHTYITFNLIIAISYLLLRMIFYTFSLQDKLSRLQLLKLMRSAFLLSVIAFFCIPGFLSLLPISYDSAFHLEPIASMVSSSVIEKINEQAVHLTGLNHSKHFFSWNLILSFIIFFSMLWVLFNYIKNLFQLQKLQKSAHCSHDFHNIKILFSSQVASPFCGSFLKKHFIMVPNNYLENKLELQIVIQHEMQHIRQGDTRWLHFISLLRIVLFLNPFYILWLKWFDEAQEFSCDESVILRKKVAPELYGQCLVNAAMNQYVIPSITLGVHNLSKKMLYRRVNMLFQYHQSLKKKTAIILSYVAVFSMAVSAAYALNPNATYAPLTETELTTMIQQEKLDRNFAITVTPEVVAQINQIRSSKQACAYMRDSLERMKTYKSYIQTALQKQNMPEDLLALPIVQSGYQSLDQSKNPVFAAGIWQIIPGTAQRYGLVVYKQRDDRLDAKLSTDAALTYLNNLYTQFHDWNLAIVAYEIGEKNTQHLTAVSGSKNVWDLARSSAAMPELKKYLAMFSAAVIIMHNPSLIEGSMR